MKFYRKRNSHMIKLAVLLIITLLGINILPALSAASSTESSPTIERYYKYSYTGTSNVYSVKNIQDGYSIEWSISDAAAGFVSFSKTNKSLRNKTVAVTGSASDIKVYTGSNARSILGTSYIVQADVYDSSGSKLVTFTDDVTVSCDAFKVLILNEPAGRTMSVGESYDFNRMLVLRGSANKTFWLVTDSNGNVVADTKNDIVTEKVNMSSVGVFTPKVADNYTIKALVYRSKRAVVLRAESETVNITVNPVPEATPTPLPTITPYPIPMFIPTPIPTSVPTPEPTSVPTPEPTSAPTPEPTSAPTPEPTTTPEYETVSYVINDYVEDLPNIVDAESITIEGSVTTNTSIVELMAEYHSDINTTIRSIAAVGTDPFTISPVPLDMGNNYITVSASAVSGTSISYAFVVARIANTSFSGVVYESDYDRDADNNLTLPDVQIKLTNLHPAPSNLTAYFATFTDSNGAFSFNSIPVGTYVLEVIKDGHITFRDDSFAITAAGNTRNIYLDEADQTSILSGIVTIADEDTNSGNNSVLPGITVTLNKIGSNTTPTVTAITNDNGIYAFENLPLGIYELSVFDSNYIPIISEIILYTANTTVYNITLESISKTYLGTGTASGTIYNALTGSGADEGLTLVVLSGYNISSGLIVATSVTGPNGAYSLTLDAGNYTVYVVDERADAATKFYDGYFNIKVMGNKTISNQNGQVTPVLEDGEIRIVLSWGSTPSDLDSHLSGPSTDGGTFHTYYSAESYSSNGITIVQLDVDDTTGYGPETTTIYSQSDGVYKFTIHDYTNSDRSYSTALANSGAYVKVYIGNTVVTYYVPNLDGTAWDVFEFDSLAGVLTALNSMYYENDPEDIGFSNALASRAMFLDTESSGDADVTDDTDDVKK